MSAKFRQKGNELLHHASCSGLSPVLFDSRTQRVLSLYREALHWASSNPERASCHKNTIVCQLKRAERTERSQEVRTFVRRSGRRLHLCRTGRQAGAQICSAQLQKLACWLEALKASLHGIAVMECMPEAWQESLVQSHAEVTQAIR